MRKLHSSLHAIQVFLTQLSGNGRYSQVAPKLTAHVLHGGCLTLNKKAMVCGQETSTIQPASCGGSAVCLKIKEAL